MRSFQLIKVLVCPEETVLVFLEETSMLGLHGADHPKRSRPTWVPFALIMFRLMKNPCRPSLHGYQSPISYPCQTHVLQGGHYYIFDKPPLEDVSPRGVYLFSDFVASTSLFSSIFDWSVHVVNWFLRLTLTQRLAFVLSLQILLVPCIHTYSCPPVCQCCRPSIAV